MWSDKDSIRLSIDTNVYHHPDRYSIYNPYPRDWNLEIRSVRTDDAGTYECRILSDPQVIKTVQLVVEGSLAEKTNFMQEYDICILITPLKSTKCYFCYRFSLASIENNTLTLVSSLQFNWMTVQPILSVGTK